jgi:hypothetical protein
MKKLLLILGIATFVFAGCGGGGDGAAKVDTASGDASGGATTTADTNFSGKGGGDFCDLAKQYEKDFDATGNATSAEDTKKEFKDLTAAIKKLVAAAPSEIKDDTKVVGDLFERYDAILAKYDYDFSKIPPAEAEKINFDDPAVTASSNRVESYFEKVCKIDSDGDGDTDGVIEDSSTPTTVAGEPSDTTDTTGE